jgi:predicted AlkP superfamily phosphohydrolase/phosphomutase
MGAAARATSLAALVAALLLGGACDRRDQSGPRVVVLGFDGLDPQVTQELLAAGRLPGFARLAKAGGFAPLGTTVPPQSPVAWSSFITGLDPGGHGIFDFIHRDAATMEPFRSTARTEPPAYVLPLGRWQWPLSSGRVELLRRGQPFWEALESRGIRTTIVRMPADFPPSGTASAELSGMGTPDLLGTYGTFTLYTSQPYAFEGLPPGGGVVHEVRVDGGVVHASLDGPDNPFLRAPTPVRTPFTARVATDGAHVALQVGDEARLLAVGEWSDWVPVTFGLAPTQALHGQVRFHLKALEPFFELYASPLNLDPLAPAMPISHPAGFAADLARGTGRFYTQGMPEDTKAVKAGVLSEDAFLAQARLAGDEVRRQYRQVLDGFTDGLLFYYFGNVDQVSHILWKARDPGHPAYDAERDARQAGVIDALYEELDGIVSDTLAALGPDDLLVVMSDHGFTSWRRTFHLNSWLRDRGYLAVKDPARREAPGYFTNVDWSRTRAYGLGLNGLYVNLRGRERDGVVEPSARAALVGEIAAALLAEIDPATGAPAVTRAHRREDVYRLDDAAERLAPDLVVGYAKGTRTSDESALGALTSEVFADNTSHWTGDHCMDHEGVPGILLSSRPLRRPAPSIDRLPAALLAEFGVEGFPAPRQEH